MALSSCGHPNVRKTRDGLKVVCACLMSVNLLMAVDIRLKEWPRHHCTDGGGPSEVLMIITVFHQHALLMYFKHDVCKEIKQREFWLCAQVGM